MPCHWFWKKNHTPEDEEERQDNAGTYLQGVVKVCPIVTTQENGKSYPRFNVDSQKLQGGFRFKLPKTLSWGAKPSIPYRGCISRLQKYITKKWTCEILGMCECLFKYNIWQKLQETNRKILHCSQYAESELLRPGSTVTELTILYILQLHTR